MLEDKKNKNNKIIVPTAIALSLYCGAQQLNKEHHKIYADDIQIHNLKNNQTNGQADSATTNSQTNSATITSQANSAITASQDKSATTVGQDKSATTTSQSQSATIVSQSQSAAPTSQSQSAAPISQSQSTTTASQSQSAATTSQSRSATTVSQNQSAISYSVIVTPDKVIYTDKNNKQLNNYSLFNHNNYAVNFAATQQHEAITYAKCAGGLRTIQVNLSQPLQGDLKSQVQFNNGNGIKNISQNGNTLTIETNSDIDPSQLMEVKLPNYNIVYDIRQENGAMMEKMVQSKEFNDKYNYNGQLGYNYQKDKTNIVEWFPTAQSVLINFYDSTDPNAKIANSVQMIKGNNGTWSYNYNGDARNKAYTFTLKFADGSSSTIYDPYAKACTAGGDRSVILAPDETQISDENDLKQLPGIAPTDAIIGEINIRDFTKDSSSGVPDNLKGTFLGAVQSGTKNTNGQPTGIDYLKQEGYTNIQIMPMFQFDNPDNKQNWGYNPKNYNVPEGWYSTNREDPATRIKECKEMIADFHKAGLRVNMDVVYNHVADPGSNGLIKSVPGYYLRYDNNGNLQNTSGCGNDINSEMPMMRKYIVNSIDYWSKEYGIDGFRFDLMGNLDIQTMNDIRSSLKDINPEAMLYGEGWNLGSKLNDGAWQADQWNEQQMPTIGTFNGYGRDVVRGNGDGTNKGFADGDTSSTVLSKLANMIVGTQNQSNTPSDAVDHDAQYNNPGQVINYAECHDNKTLFDKIKGIYPNEPDNVTMRRAELATSITDLAEGVPFLQVGQEFGRSKNGDPNSYNTGDAENSIKWNNESKFSWAADYQKGLAKLREEVPGFRYGAFNDINNNIKWCQIGNGIVGYKMTDPTGTYIVAFNGNPGDAVLSGIDNGHYKVLIQDCNSYVDNPKDANITDGKINMSSLSTLVMRLDTPKPKNQFIGSNNKYFYYDNNGNMVHGWQTIDGHKQYYDLTTGEQYKLGTYAIDGKNYTFDKLGNLVENTQPSTNNGSGSAAPTSHANSTAPTSHANSATPTSHASSATSTSHANSAIPTSHASSATSTSHASSATPTSHASSATPVSHASSATPTSHASSATPTSHASSATSTGQSSSATTTGQSNSATTAGQSNSANAASQSSSANTASQSNSVSTASQSSSANTASQSSSANTASQSSSANTASQSNSAITTSQSNSAITTGQSSSAALTSHASSVATTSQNNLTTTAGQSSSASQSSSATTTSQSNSAIPTGQSSSATTVDQNSSATLTSQSSSATTASQSSSANTIGQSSLANTVGQSSLANTTSQNSLIMNNQLIQTNNKNNNDLSMLSLIGISLTDLIALGFINKKKN